MKERIPTLKKLFFLKLKFAATSSVATLVDYLLYIVLVYTVLAPVPSNLISATVGMIVNFVLQKRFVFDMKRKLSHTFLMAMAISVGGILLGTFIIYMLSKVEFFAEYQFITKLFATGTVFFYNFYFKRFAFEKRFFSVD